MTDLEPCPWCAAPGAFADTDPGKPFGTFVMCKADCDMCTSTNWHDTREGAASQWNTRAPSAAARERDPLREALTAVLDAASYHEGEGGRRSYGLRPSFGEAYQQARQALNQEHSA